MRLEYWLLEVIMWCYFSPKISCYHPYEWDHHVHHALYTSIYHFTAKGTHYKCCHIQCRTTS